ncbi:Hypp8916 [Branchiostoma lanceolatum]|uniref:Hypp8916 protein n=1 Tax=Branchiostoma lanceolatum TaxID=7740 RepID=A0A8J9ZBV6_BRALA|nr:Hypp8916 [Branchiostoma lanceolatum]
MDERNNVASIDKYLKRPRKQVSSTIVGPLWSILSGILSALSATLLQLAAGVPLFHTIVVRCSVQLLAAVVVLWARGGSDFATVRRRTLPWLALRGLVAFLAFCTNDYASTILPLGEAIAIRQTSPIFTAFLGFLFFGEPVGGLEILLAGMCWLGVTLISSSQAADSHDDLDPAVTTKTLGVTVAMVGAMCAALAFLVVGKLSRKDKVSTNILVFVRCLVTTVLSAGSNVLFLGGMSDVMNMSGSNVILLVTSALCDLGSNFSLTKGLSLSKVASHSIILRNSNVLVSFLIQIVVFSDFPSAPSLAGAAVIVISGVITAVKSR